MVKTVRIHIFKLNYAGITSITSLIPFFIRNFKGEIIVRLFMDVIYSENS